MPVIINGTTGITDVNGTAAAPALTGTDTDTGIFFPAANTLAFSTNGTEDARFDSAGNLGLGTSTINNAVTTYRGAGVSNYIQFTNATTGTASTDGCLIGVAADDTSLRLRVLEAASMIFSTSDTERMRLNSSENLGLGTTSPESNGGYSAMTISNTDGGQTYWKSTGSSVTAYAGADAVGAYLATLTNHALIFRTNNTERARIDSSGNLLVGTTTASSKLTVNSEMSLAADNNNRGILTWSSGGLVFGTINASTTYFNSMTLKDGNLLIGATGSVMSGGGKIEIRGDFYNGNTGIALSTSNDTTGALYAQFGNSAGTRIGSITRSGTSTVAYNTSSDYRLKENVQPMVGVLAKIQALRPVTYQWKEDGSDGEGFIAHELAEVCPQAVAGEKDAVDADGNPVYQGIDTSFLVATLTAAIQEQQAIINQLQADVAALKGNA